MTLNAIIFISYSFTANKLKWYCAVKINGGVRAKTTSLRTAQKALGRGSKNSRQAIIPMTARQSGDPHKLAKGWRGGSMWWYGWNDIHKMQAMCRRAGLPNQKKVKSEFCLLWH